MDATQPKDLEKLQAQMEQAKKVIPLETLLVTKTVKFWVPPEIAFFMVSNKFIEMRTGQIFKCHQSSCLMKTSTLLNNIKILYLRPLEARQGSLIHFALWIALAPSSLLAN